MNTNKPIAAGMLACALSKALALVALLSLLLLSANAQTTVATVTTNGISEPYNVVAASDGTFYFTDSAHNRIVRVDASTQAATTVAGIQSDPPGFDNGAPYAAHFNNPEGLLLVNRRGTNGLLVTDTGNHALRFIDLETSETSTLASGSAYFYYPMGMTPDGRNNVYIADWGHNAIKVVNLNETNATLTVSTLTISGGAGTCSTLSRPTAVAFVGNNQLWIADTGNQQIKLITLDTQTVITTNGNTITTNTIVNTTSGSLTAYVGTCRTTGTNDALAGMNARFNGPSGLLWTSGSLLVSDTLNNSIRRITNNSTLGANNYSVSTYAGIPSQAGFADGNPLGVAKFNSPYGLSLDLANNGFLIADLKNNAIRRIQLGAPLPPVPAPRIGWVDFPPPNFWSVLRVNQPFVFNNDQIIAIDGTEGSETRYESGPTPPNPLDLSSIPDPTATSGHTPPFYRDGEYSAPATIVQPQPDFIIKAIGTQAGRQSSPVVFARFQYKAGNPSISGNNAALFTVETVTTGAEMWYTTNDTVPMKEGTNSMRIGAISTNLSFVITTNLVFKIRAFRDGYLPSDVVVQVFSTNNFDATKISFGFASGEASSDFVGSPGQFFYSPVTLSLLDGVKMYSLQFNLTVTNGINSPAITPGAFGFESFLEKPIPNTTPVIYERIPPLAYVGSYNNPPPDSVLVTNRYGDRFVKMTIANTNQNLLGVGWLERLTKTNLYDTTKQDLIKYSQPHDTLFDEDNNLIVVGGYGFQIPPNARSGDTYRIRIGLPSATSDGVGGPGSDVYIAAPTNGSLGSGTINALKDVTVGQRKYIAGDPAPFRWFNAGDFGNTNLNNADVMQVFQSAVYAFNYPPAGSDFFDSMDSCGSTYTATNGYLVAVPTVYGYGTNYSTNIFGEVTTNVFLDTSRNNKFFDGNDTAINCMAFGDGRLDVCDVYVTFRRSLDPSLTWFRRFWTNGVLGAEVVPGTPNPGGNCLPNNSSSASVAFSSADAVASPGQTVQIPIKAQITGNYPLKLAMLNLSVQPLAGSAPLDSSVQFSANPALGQPTLTDSRGSGNYAATWLNSAVSGLSGNATIGTLTVRVPTNATPTAAYAIHFDHASASPNGIASFPAKLSTGLITLSDRSGSSFNDGIPDSWRLRYFGSLDNVLADKNADADGDGGNNWQEFIAGTDPTDPTSVLRASAAKAQSGQDRLIRWPSVSGKTYVIERCANLFAPNWIPVSTNNGTGADLEFHDNTGGTPRFFRVRVQ